MALTPDHVLLGLGLVLVLEGLLWAGLPDTMRRLMLSLADQDPARLRWVGLIGAGLGVGLLLIYRRLGAG